MDVEDDVRPPWRVQRAFSLPKRNGEPNEDKWRESSDGTICAMSDGASVSFDPGSWAEILVSRFIDDSSVSRDWLAAAVAEYRSSYNRETMVWMQQAAFDRGSFATLLGVVWSTDCRNIRVIAIGDSLLAFVDGRDLVQTIPYIEPSDFDQSPRLLSTNPVENLALDDEALAEAWHDLNITSHQAPALLLMTDAIGRWLLDQPDARRVSVLLDMSDDAAFEQFVERERVEGRLRKDDSTLVIFGSAQ
jgi:hypothetical protein